LFSGILGRLARRLLHIGQANAISNRTTAQRAKGEKNMKKMKKWLYETWMDMIEPDDRLLGATPFDVAVAATVIILIIAR